MPCLLGAPLPRFSFFRTGSGPAITYESAARKKRTVWISPDFTHAHPVLSNILAVRLSRSMPWKVGRERGEFLDIVHRRHRAGRSPMETIALVTLVELATPDLSRAKRLAAQTAPQILANLQRSISSAGFCKR